MTKSKLPEAVAKIVAILTPLAAEERTRIVRASLTLLGEELKDEATAEAPEIRRMPARARAWIKQNNLSTDDVQEVFHISEGNVSVIAEIPGGNNKERVHNCYVLTGITKFLLTGDPSFDDKSAKALCQSSGCYDPTNHAKYLKNKGNDFTGSKEKGWTLTSPGLKRGAQLVKELSAAK